MQQSHTQTALTLAAIGVVYGDIGTSPLYTLRECFHTSGLSVTPATLLGLLSLIAWSLILVVTVKYVSFILRADNKSEGGILALTVLAESIRAKLAGAGTRTRRTIVVLGLTGGALFFGDALITPAITILGAMEGLDIISPGFDRYVVPLSIFCIVLLFAAQKYGTARMGEFFGPLMLVWFGVLAILGLFGIFNNPAVLAALNPVYGISFLLTHHLAGFLAMGAVVLAVTGAEALYADLGHFGRKPIQRAWLLLVGPSLILNYFGQGAIILATPHMLENPFYFLAPEALRLPLLLLATGAAVVAAQAVITGAFSLTHQAMQMGYLPRFHIQHTNENQAGQIYIPALNRILFAGVLTLILTFHTSSNLAAAYGIAVAGTMAITTLLATAVLYGRFRWPLWAAAGFGTAFIVLDLLFLTANLHKIPHGGWLALSIAGVLLFLMHTWLKGREVTRKQVLRKTLPLNEFLNDELPELLKTHQVHRPARAAVYLTGDLAMVPIALRYNIIHNQSLHAEVVLTKVSRAPTPRHPASDRLRLTKHKHGFFTLEIIYGFMEFPNIPAALNEASQSLGLPFSPRENTTYFVGQHTYIPGTATKGGLNPIQEPVFILLEWLSLPAIRFFRLPRAQVVEIGDHLEI